MLQKREDFHGWKVFPNGRSVIWSELKFHRPTRHSLRVEKTQLLDVTVEGDIRKLISWIHDSTHVQIWNIHIRYITICIHVQIWIFNKYSCEATSKGCQWNLNKWRIDTLWELNHLAPSRYVSSIDYIDILYASKQMMKVATKIPSIFQKLQPSCGWLWSPDRWTHGNMISLTRPKGYHTFPPQIWRVKRLTFVDTEKNGGS